MAQSPDTRGRSHCRNCGFETDDQSAWETVDTPTLGELTSCPECGSTKVTDLS